MWVTTANAGSRPWCWAIQIGSLTSIMDGGFIRTAAGIGNRITRGVGPLFIMADGFVTRAWAGAGVRMMHGGHHGFAGARQMITAVGHPYRPARALPRLA